MYFVSGTFRWKSSFSFNPPQILNVLQADEVMVALLFLLHDFPGTTEETRSQVEKLVESEVSPSSNAAACLDCDIP